GKTAFALSLPGIANYYHGHWATDQWNDDADYIVLDDIPWNEYTQRGFASAQDLITGQQFVSVNDKYGKIKKINTAMPAIVLLNPHHAADLLKLLDKNNNSHMARFWQERSFLYVMGENEYFYNPTMHKEKEKQIIYTVDHLPVFQEARRRWLNSQQQNITDEDGTEDSSGKQFDNESVVSEEYSLHG
ncbi:unnamed protein product, partial [Adineta ricciae]